MEQFDSKLSSIIDATLGRRCTLYGYQYSEIIRSLMCVYFCGGSCIEDVTTHLMPHLSLHPTLRTCSADTILRAISELTQENISYRSDMGKTYGFNTVDRLNTLLVKALLSMGQLSEGGTYDVDFDHQFIETEKYDAKPTYKKFLGYRPGVAVIGDVIVGIENSDGNTNVRFHQEDTLKRFFERLGASGISVGRFRADCGSCSESIVSEWRSTAGTSISGPTDAAPSMTTYLQSGGGRERSRVASLLNWPPFSSRNGRERHTVSSFSDRNAWAVSLTFGKASTHTGAYLPMTTILPNGR